LSKLSVPFQILLTGKTCLLLVRDFLFKVVIIGDSAAGKSSILYRFVDNKFDPTFMSTIGIDYKFKYVGEEGRKKGWERERRERQERRERRREGRQGAAGKSSILYRFVDNKFPPTFMSTIGIEENSGMLGESKKLGGGRTEGGRRVRSEKGDEEGRRQKAEGSAEGKQRERIGE
jgi:hypothetical protein